MISTRITREDGLEAPIASAGMAFVATPPLAAAVSNAGGLGMLGGVMVPPGPLREMIRGVRWLTVRSFGVDLDAGRLGGGGPGGGRAGL
jgi:enoyl-[acyl-carrier protein] reductase II